MKVLITGAGGFLGRGLVIPFAEAGHQLRLMDVAAFESPHEVVVGSVADTEQVAAAMQGMDAVVIAHMAPRGEGDINYKTPAMPFAINVTGTANCFHAAQACGIRKVVVISSTAAIHENNTIGAAPSAQPLRAKGYYGMSKAIQEVIAEQFARTANMQVACLRVGYILDGEANVDKYGRSVAERNFQDTDRRDIGSAALACFECADLTYEVFHVMSTEESLDRAAVRYTCDRLGWKPRYDFSWLREPGSSAKGTA
jgi:nucleoside-diphosphate-sugar epimerase